MTLNSYRADPRPDQVLFAMAVHVLKEHHDLGRMWPLSYTLPNGRSIEAVCDRVAHLDTAIPPELLHVLHDLLKAVAIPVPVTERYSDYAFVLREVALYLALPFDQRRTWTVPSEG